jgi:hypothetical protein
MCAYRTVEYQLTIPPVLVAADVLWNRCLAMAIPHLFVATDMCVIEAMASNGRLLFFRYSGF